MPKVRGSMGWSLSIPTTSVLDRSTLLGICTLFFTFLNSTCRVEAQAHIMVLSSRQSSEIRRGGSGF